MTTDTNQQQQQQQQQQQPISSLTKLLHESSSTLTTPVLSKNPSEVSLNSQHVKSSTVSGVNSTINSPLSENNNNNGNDNSSAGINIASSKPKPPAIDTSGSTNNGPHIIHGFDPSPSPSPNTKPFPSTNTSSSFTPTSPFTRQSSNSFQAIMLFKTLLDQL